MLKEGKMGWDQGHVTWDVARMLSGTVPTECLNYFRKGAWPSSHDPAIFWALCANSYKTVEATVQTSNLCQFQ